MPTDVCANCHEPLFIEIESDSDSERQSAQNSSIPGSIPDDVELRCGCHYHWECFLDAYTVTECPNCSKDISSLSGGGGQQQVLCTVRNEGGVEHDFDILPSATEEAYLRTYPEERLGHAFLEFCREGDIDAIVHLIKDVELNEAEHESERMDILRYQGTFEGIEGSGLHVAITYSQEEVAWLMLVLASSLDWAQFPPWVLQEMKALKLSKEDRKAGIDVRSLQDSDGRTAAALAQESGGVWSDWCNNGRLLPG